MSTLETAKIRQFPAIELCSIGRERHEWKVEFHLFAVQILRYVQMQWAPFKYTVASIFIQLLQILNRNTVPASSGARYNRPFL